MTLYEVAKQLHGLSGGIVNYEKRTKKQIYNTLQKGMIFAEHNKIPNTLVVSVRLNDGYWLATVFKCPAGYDYWIPDTREEEQRIWDRLTK